MKWDQRFLNLAKHVSGWSLDPSTKCGAVITRPDYSVVSIGYNGLPKGVEDTKERLTNRKLKYDMIVHAERNALLFAKQDLTGYTLFTFPFMPCSICAGMAIQAGISRVVSFESDNPRWAKNFMLSESMLLEADVEVDLL